jgi:predicted dehydrogenase
MTTRRAIVVGSGWGAHAARALVAHPHVQLRGIVGRGSPRTIALAAELGARHFSELREAIAACNPELAVVAAGESLNAALTRILIEAGADVLCAHPVAPDAPSVRQLDRKARELRRVVCVDYSFRARPELEALRSTDRLGAMMRIAIVAPGRWLPITLDVATVLGGRVVRVLASRNYPSGISERAARSPGLFSPAILLEHASGTVSTLTSSPHADPYAPVDVVLGLEHGRATASLPAGGAELLQCRRGGVVHRERLVAPSTFASPLKAHGSCMQALVHRFVERPDAMLCTLEEEGHLREVWAACWRSARARTPVDVDTRAP